MGLRLDIARRDRGRPFCSGRRNSPGSGKYTLDIDPGREVRRGAWQRRAPYDKAGGGWVENTATVTNLTTGASISASNKNSGWVVGAGVEWAIGGNWSAKLEYDFPKLDDLTFGPGPFQGDTFTASREIQMFKVGLNYRFGSLFAGGYGGSY